MKIVNTTGSPFDTRVFDDEGRDITEGLRLRKIVIEADMPVTATFTCIVSELAVVAKGQFVSDDASPQNNSNGDK